MIQARIGIGSLVFAGLLMVAGSASQAADITALLDDNEGDSAFVITDSDTNPLLRIDSQGVIQAMGPLTSAGGFIGDGAGLTNLVEADPLWAAVSNAMLSATSSWWQAFMWGDHAGAGYLTAFTESDPVWGAVSNAVTTGAAQGAVAHDWGDHGAEGYLTMESDPVWSAVSNTVRTQAAQGADAYGWGPHEGAGYLIAEADPLWSAVSNDFVRKAGDTMTGALTINVGVDNLLAISSVGTPIRIGNGAQAGATGIAVGRDADGSSWGVAIGRDANAMNSAVAIGNASHAHSQGVSVGFEANSTVAGSALGMSSDGHQQGVAVGWLAKGSTNGVAVGYSSRGQNSGVAVGRSANGEGSGAAIGYQALGNNAGAAVGHQANGAVSGVAIGQGAVATEYGVAVGRQSVGSFEGAAMGYLANARVEGVALGRSANAHARGIALGFQALGVETNIAIGVNAHAQGQNRIAIGQAVTNTIDNSTWIRGNLYLDGGTRMYGRPFPGSGPFEQLLPLPLLENVVYVATNGTQFGPGTIDRPFDTPQRGYNAATNLYPNSPAAVLIAAGRYAGATLNMHQGNIHVIGHGSAEIDRLNVLAPAAFIQTKQRIENLVVQTRTEVQGSAMNVKFFNCRFTGEGLLIYGSGIEVQNCFASNDGAGSGVAVTIGMGVPLSDVALYHSSFYNNGPVPTLRVEVNVSNFQVNGCQIVNEGGGACIEDLEDKPIFPVHLYTHNYIKGMAPSLGSAEAVQDPNAGLGGGGFTIAFTHNTVLGHVGVNQHRQYFANNTVYGIINNVLGPGTSGWLQAGAGTGIDGSGNIEHEAGFPTLPSAWRD